MSTGRLEKEFPNFGHFWIHQVCTAISKHFSSKYVHLPQTENEMRTKFTQFETKFGMVLAFGCIDGTHIHVQRSIVNSQDYFNYKNVFSVNVQACSV